MKDIKNIKNWKDYWKIFDDLCHSLTNQGKTEIAQEFKEAQKYVNGLTDEWFDFLEKFKAAYNNNIHYFEFEDKEKAKLLINAVSASLKVR